MFARAAVTLTVPLSHATDLTALASVLHVLGTRARLETIQLLLDGPRETPDLPARIDELHMLEDIGVVTSSRISRQRIRWALVPGALERVAGCLNG